MGAEGHPMRRVDLVVESFRPGVVDRLGIGHDDVTDREERKKVRRNTLAVNRVRLRSIENANAI